MALTSSPMSSATALKRRCSAPLSLSVRTRSRSGIEVRIANVLRTVNDYLSRIEAPEHPLEAGDAKVELPAQPSRHGWREHDCARLGEPRGARHESQNGGQAVLCLTMSSLYRPPSKRAVILSPAPTSWMVPSGAMSCAWAGARKSSNGPSGRRGFGGVIRFGLPFGGRGCPPRRARAFAAGSTPRSCRRSSGAPCRSTLGAPNPSGARGARTSRARSASWAAPRARAARGGRA